MIENVITKLVFYLIQVLKIVVSQGTIRVSQYFKLYRKQYYEIFSKFISWNILWKFNTKPYETKEKIWIIQTYNSKSVDTANNPRPWLSLYYPFHRPPPQSPHTFILNLTRFLLFCEMGDGRMGVIQKYFMTLREMHIS